MNTSGPDRPTTLYVVHRAVLAGIAISITLAAVVLTVLVVPAVGTWVSSAINSLHGTWISWHWSLL
jgi:hypothetical protein